MLALVFSSVSAVFDLPVVSGASSQVYVSPANNIFYTGTTAVNSRFNVTVWVGNVSDLACWQVQMNYNSSMLNITRVWQPLWDKQYVFYAKTTYPVVSCGAGYVLLGDVLLPLSQSSFAGNGELCILEFQVLACPQKGQELSSVLDITQASYGTYLIDSNTNPIPISKTNGYYQYIDSFLQFSNFGELFANNFVHIVYPSNSSGKPLGCAQAMVSDWAASAFVYSLLNNGIEGLDTDAAFVNQTTGEPQGASGIGVVSFGGPAVNLILNYAENPSIAADDRAPVKFYVSGNVFGFQCANGTNVQGATLNSSYIGNSKDMFVIEMYQDRKGRNIMLCYGFGWKGTYAAGKYFYTTIYPDLQHQSESWIIVKWEDTNSNGLVDMEKGGDTYTVIATGNWARP